MRKWIDNTLAESPSTTLAYVIFEEVKQQWQQQQQQQRDIDVPVLTQWMMERAGNATKAAAVKEDLCAGYHTPVYSHAGRGHFQDVYEPAEDSFLLMDALEKDARRLQTIRSDPRHTFCCNSTGNEPCHSHQVRVSPLSAARLCVWRWAAALERCPPSWRRWLDLQRYTCEPISHLQWDTLMHEHSVIPAVCLPVALMWILQQRSAQRRRPPATVFHYNPSSQTWWDFHMHMHRFLMNHNAYLNVFLSSGGVSSAPAEWTCGRPALQSPLRGDTVRGGDASESSTPSAGGRRGAF